MARTKDFDEAEVLNKAVCLFWHKGYNGTSMQELVDHLGISRSSLYDTYADKHTLYIKALEFYQNTSGARIFEIVNNNLPAREKIKKLLEFVSAELLNDDQHKGCFMVNAEVEVAPHDTEVRDIVCRNEIQLEEAFYAVIDQGQKNGEIPNNQDARALTRFIINTVKGIRVSAKSSVDNAFFGDIIRITLSVLD
ncbi:TetR/AcrR family transcriptional regulator [Dyadobacter luticola]|uniref:TetR/AcrR family transcriptional regulator n=1 Tax=Dyadobacter luticola TaxID=1979387 RepID=A0A5R9L183_9BACT|nr:TetR/AcrR family transcriptional regulator [Dyadobacter luticola]TLV02117.1 TetR/AcrR family transcriptional regulator [Dyadobacter luticola]